MICPVYVHLGDEQHAHGVILPDFEGCYTAADEYNDLPSNIQQVIELHFEGESFEIPKPSDIVSLELSGKYKDGVWMLVDVNVAKLASKPMQLDVSLPSHVVNQMDKYANKNKLTRNAFFEKATESYLGMHDI